MRAAATILALILLAWALATPPTLRPIMPPVEHELIGASRERPTVALLRPAPVAPRVHARSWQHRRTLVAAAERAFGPRPPAALLAAQVEVESAWRTEAVSPAGAQGLGQIMPRTAAGLAARYPELGPARPHDPVWSLRAQALYMREAYDEYADLLGCARWQFALSRYNGGGRMLARERARAADPNRWDGPGGVAEQRVRSVAAWRENRGYVPAVLRLEPQYARAGYGGSLSGCTYG